MAWSILPHRSNAPSTSKSSVLTTKLRKLSPAAKNAFAKNWKKLRQTKTPSAFNISTSKHRATSHLARQLLLAVEEADDLVPSEYVGKRKILDIFAPVKLITRSPLDPQATAMAVDSDCAKPLYCDDIMDVCVELDASISAETMEIDPAISDVDVPMLPPGLEHTDMDMELSFPADDPMDIIDDASLDEPMVLSTPEIAQVSGFSPMILCSPEIQQVFVFSPMALCSPEPPVADTFPSVDELADALESALISVRHETVELPVVDDLQITLEDLSLGSAQPVEDDLPPTALVPANADSAALALQGLHIELVDSAASSSSLATTLGSESYLSDLDDVQTVSSPSPAPDEPASITVLEESSVTFGPVEDAVIVKEEPTTPVLPPSPTIANMKQEPVSPTISFLDLPPPCVAVIDGSHPGLDDTISDASTLVDALANLKVEPCEDGIDTSLEASPLASKSKPKGCLRYPKGLRASKAKAPDRQVRFAPYVAKESSIGQQKRLRGKIKRIESCSSRGRSNAT